MAPPQYKMAKSLHKLNLFDSIIMIKNWKYILELLKVRQIWFVEKFYLRLTQKKIHCSSKQWIFPFSKQ